MSALRELIEALGREEATIDAVRAALVDAAANDTASREELAELLAAARERLGDDRVRQLQAAIDAVLDDRTVVLPDPDAKEAGSVDDDRTVVLPDADKKVEPPADDDRTVVLPDPDGVTASPSGDDRTVMLADSDPDTEDATLVNMRAGASDSTTEVNFRAGGSEEPTVLNQPTRGADETVFPDPESDEAATVLNVRATDEDEVTVVNQGRDRTLIHEADDPGEDPTVLNVGSGDPGASGEDTTVVAAADGDATVINAGDDATVVNRDDDSTLVNEPAPGEFDILSDDALAAADNAATGAS